MRPRDNQIGTLTIVAAAVALLLVAAGGHGAGRTTFGVGAASWRDLLGGPRPEVAAGRHSIVLLRAPSVAEQVARAGGRSDGESQRLWTAAAVAAQQQLIARIVGEGASIRTEFRYSHVVNGFSAALDARAQALLEADPEVRGVYAVRTASPATASASPAAPGSGALAYWPGGSLPGFSGRGVTVALLDTGVDLFHPSLDGHVAQGIDLVDGGDSALARSRPGSMADVERHGTEMAGVLATIAPGATVLPIRVGGWQRTVTGRWAVFARSDQLLAGLERAVDPNDDGDARDAVPIAVTGLVEPYAAFASGPFGHAARGALDLGTLLVVPAGNDGPAGPVFGSVSGPGGAPAALTVGAADTRRFAKEVRVAIRVGLQSEFGGVLPLAGGAVPDRTITARVVLPPAFRGAAAGSAGSTLRDFFDAKGFSHVAGRAALLPARGPLERSVRNAARAGAVAVLLYGSQIPPGAIGTVEVPGVPVVGLTNAAAVRTLAALRTGAPVAVSIGNARSIRNASAGRAAPFSSRGLAFDGRIKPDVVAPGVGLRAPDPGVLEDGTPRFVTVNGSSVATAATAGALGLLAEARPGLGPDALRSLVVGTARRADRDPLTAAGAGLVDVGAAAALEVVALPATVALGPARVRAPMPPRTVVLRNVSTRRLTVFVAARGGLRDARVTVSPTRVELAPAQTARLRVTATARRRPGSGLAQGFLLVTPRGGAPLRVPWALGFLPPRLDLLDRVRLSRSEFAPSDDAPAVLVFQVGRVERAAGRNALYPAARLDVELWRTGRRPRRLGLLARLRDLLPGRYALGLTGRGPSGDVLPRGRYALRLVAVPTVRAPATTARVSFRIT